MQDLAAFHREKLALPVIQITGTNGKTTTKELVSTVLAKKYNVLHTEANYNNHIGVPKTLLRLGKEHEIAVIETGANHRGEIAQLTNIVHPDYGIITNVGRAHLEGFGSFEGVVHTKAELYDYLRKKKDGAIFLNSDSEILCRVAEGLKAYKYGTKAEAHPEVLGLETATSGKFFLDGKTVSGTGAERGMVFQKYTLFPWLSVKQNVMFGLESIGYGKDEAEESAYQWQKCLFSNYHFSNIHRMKTINVFFRTDCHNHLIFINMLRQRQLNQNSMNRTVFVQFVNQSQKFLFCRIFW